MSNNPYQPPLATGTQEDTAPTPAIGGLGLRVVAYLIDVIPITLLLAAVFYVFLGFDETVQRYFNREPDDLDARLAFLTQRNQIRDLSFLVYILYCAVLEGSALQGTIGKRLLGLRVTDSQGRHLTVGKAFARNSAKIISYLPCALGFLWALWSKQKRGWHDMIARTLVVKSTGE